MTTHADNETIIGAFQRGSMCRFILKPFDAVEVKEIIDASYQIYLLNRIKEELYKEWIKTYGDINI